MNDTISTDALRDLMASTATSHRDGCACHICKAAGGSEEEFAYCAAGVMLGGLRVLERWDSHSAVPPHNFKARRAPANEINRKADR